MLFPNQNRQKDIDMRLTTALWDSLIVGCQTIVIILP